jgi:hypothetical protein
MPTDTIWIWRKAWGTVQEGRKAGRKEGRSVQEGAEGRKVSTGRYRRKEVQDRRKEG